MKKPKQPPIDIDNPFKQKINVIKVGEIEIHSSTEKMPMLIKYMQKLIEDYETYNNLKTIDKIRKGVGGIG